MELVVLSGKGGTGKTTIASAIATLTDAVQCVDADVDAPNFYLYFQKEEEDSRKEFFAGRVAEIQSDKCVECGKCQEACRFQAIHNHKVNALLCEGCGVCKWVCPVEAISLEEVKTAEIIRTMYENKGLVRAEMEIGSDKSGKLITVLRQEAKEHSEGWSQLIDGSPGIGCSVIASITGAKKALIVTEPTLSGKKDLLRVLELCQEFQVEPLVVINKWDINEEVTDELKEELEKINVKCVGQIPYDITVSKAIDELKPITAYEQSEANKAVRQMWHNIKACLKGA